MNNILKIILLLLLISLLSKTYSQIKIKPELKEFSFGKAYFYNDRTYGHYPEIENETHEIDTLGILSKDSCFFISHKTYTSIYMDTSLKKFLFADEIKNLYFDNIWGTIQINFYSFTQGKEINKGLYIYGVDDIGFFNIKFMKEIGIHYLWGAVRISDVTFYKNFNLIESKLYGTQLSSINVWGITKLDKNTYREYPFEITDSKFHRITFSIDTFQVDATFYNVIFNSNTDFSQTVFYKKSNFLSCTFRDTLNLNQVDIYNEIDFRTCNFDSVKTIYLDLFKYPIGKLFIQWDQIKEKNNSYRIQTLDTNETKKNMYNYLDIIYKRLIANYLTQGDNVSADAVKYELESRKDKIFGGTSQRLYGIFLGYGYKPWRYLFFVVLPVIIVFALLLYFYYYSVIFEILDKDFKRDEMKMVRIKRKLFLPKYYLEKNDESQEEINFITRFWHSIFFSTSLILGIRFKKEWIHRYNKAFLFTISIGYVLGITMFFIFVIYVKSSRFDFLKGIFGL